jgi:hypothetical protein
MGPDNFPRRKVREFSKLGGSDSPGEWLISSPETDGIQAETAGGELRQIAASSGRPVNYLHAAGVADTAGDASCVADDVVTTFRNPIPRTEWTLPARISLRSLRGLLFLSRCLSENEQKQTKEAKQ